MTAKQDQLTLIERTIENANKLGNKRDAYTLGSLLKHRQKKKLTYRQEDFLKKLIERNDAKAIKAKADANADWAKEWQADAELREKAEVVARYYAKAGYYSTASAGVLMSLKGDTDMLPKRYSVMKMINNPYAEKVWESQRHAPLWSVGQLVCCRATASGRFHLVSGDKQYWKHAGDGVYTIIQVNSRPIDKALSYKPKQGGARYYKLLMLGSSRIIEVMEMDLKNVQKKLLV